VTNQELYNRVVAHLRKQGCAAKLVKRGSNNSNFSACRYRTDDGKKCAIGCLIPDERYSGALEGRMVYQQEVLRAAGLTSKNVTLATRLQRIHDCKPVDDWESEFVLVAQEFGLEEVPLGQPV
jgi:hypothetical protein